MFMQCLGDEVEVFITEIVQVNPADLSAKVDVAVGIMIDWGGFSLCGLTMR